MSRFEFFTDEEQEQYGIDPQDGASMFTAFEHYGDESLGRYDRTECIRFILEALRHEFSFDVVQKLIQSSIQVLALEEYTYFDRTTKEDRVNQFYIDIIDAVIEHFDVLSTYPNLMESFLEHFTGDNKRDFSAQVTALMSAECFDAAVIFLSERYCENVFESLCVISMSSRLRRAVDSVYTAASVGTSSVTSTEGASEYLVALIILHLHRSCNLKKEESRENAFIKSNELIGECDAHQKKNIVQAILRLSADKHLDFFESLIHACDDIDFLACIVEVIDGNDVASSTSSSILKVSALFGQRLYDEGLSALRYRQDHRIANVIFVELYAKTGEHPSVIYHSLKVMNSAPSRWHLRRIFQGLNELLLEKGSRHMADVLKLRAHLAKKLMTGSVDERIQLHVTALTEIYRLYLESVSDHVQSEKLRMAYHSTQTDLAAVIFAEVERLDNPHVRVEKLEEWVGMFQTLMDVTIAYSYEHVVPETWYERACDLLAVTQEECASLPSTSNATAPLDSDDEAPLLPAHSPASDVTPTAPSDSSRDSEDLDDDEAGLLPTYEEATAGDPVPQAPRLTRSFSDPSLAIVGALHAGMLVFTPEDYAARLAEARRSAREAAFEEVLEQLGVVPDGP